jgi:predicted Zn-dependent protease
MMICGACHSSSESVSRSVITSPPAFLPVYYASVFINSSNPLLYVSKDKTNGVARYLYSYSDNSATVSVESIECDKPQCDAVYNNILRHFNQLISSQKGAFIEISETEMHADVNMVNGIETVFAFVLPKSVNVWTFTRSFSSRERFADRFKEIRGLNDRQRYEEALLSGNVSMGHWRKSIYNYAKELLSTGKKSDALIVLKNLLSTSPYDYEAHVAFMENTADFAAAMNSAKIVRKNAESSEQISKAIDFMKEEPRSISLISPLKSNEKGLQLILIPLAPCNPWLLDEAAKVYERITEIPVKIRRMDEEWTWGVPERIYQERYIQNILVSLEKKNKDFAGWKKEQYIKALSEAVKSEDALSKYWINDLIRNIESEPGQYFVDPYLNRLRDKLRKYRSDDIRSMYVGITEANIYSGDNNFLFSFGNTDMVSPASILSYYMMMGKALNETYDSKQRLVERIAKELVPASLKQLGIPRSTDPTCPYSYSSGVDRLDQKTLELSDEVKQALKKLKESPAGTNIR